MQDQDTGEATTEIMASITDQGSMVCLRAERSRLPAKRPLIPASH